MNKFLAKTFLIFLPVFALFVFFNNCNTAFANTGTIDSSNFTSYLCADAACTTGSRIVWRTTNGTPVSISDSILSGNIWGEKIGWINLNPSNSGVVNNSHGVLSGYAWGQNTGWINFKPTNGGVSINTSNGEFSGWAWAQNYGWIKFDCASGVNFCVKTNWRPEHIVVGGGGTSTNPPVTPPVVPPTVPPEIPTVPTAPEIPPVVPPVVEPEIPVISEPENPTIPTTPEIPSINPPSAQEPNIITITDNINNFVNSVHMPIDNFLKNNFTPEQIVKIDTGLKVTTVGSAVVGGAVSLSSILFLNPLTGSELLLIPFRLWSLLLTALGIKKRVKPWGTVYDSVTKQPLDPVYVSLVNLEGEEIASAITDLDGRYGFYVEPGVYKVIPNKTNYIFPSHALSNKLQDEFYQDLYFGDYMNVAQGQVIANNIPMDPVNFDWNEFAKNKKQLFKFYSKKELIIARISNVLFGIGFSISAISLVLFPEIYNAVIFVLYILIFILKRSKFMIRAKGRIVDSDGSPLSFAFIRVYSVATNVEMLHKVADKMGRYHILLPNGNYYVKIEKKNADSTYTVVHTSESIEIKQGTLNKVFNI